MSVEVDSSGPVLDGRAEGIARDIADIAGERTALVGVGVVRDTLGPRLQNPTGRYMASIHAESVGSLHTVTDDDQVYGPWLEGVGSRNRTTRFKGYAAFRRSVQQLDRMAERVTEAAVTANLHRLEG